MFHLDLFSGIGGFAYALDQSKIDIESRYYSEVDATATRIYNKHFPNAKAIGDITSADWSLLPKGDWIVTGGFPCQDISSGNINAEGITGSRSGLWSEMHRAIAELRPKWVIIENVAILRSRGLCRVLSSLAEVGYDAEWQTIPAHQVGLPHNRNRIWIVAYPSDDIRHGQPLRTEGTRYMGINRQSSLEINRHRIWADWHDAKKNARHKIPKPLVFGIDDGIPHLLDRVAALGNALVPQIPLQIANRIFDLQA